MPRLSRFYYPGATLHVLQRGNNRAAVFTCLRYVELNPVRARIVDAPAEYRWSSHRANAWGTDDRIVTPHPLFLALAPSAEERREIYLRSFGQPLEDRAVDSIRNATRFEWALGDIAFRVGGRSTHGPARRAPFEGPPASRRRTLENRL
jgi:putative transposase